MGWWAALAGAAVGAVGTQQAGGSQIHALEDQATVSEEQGAADEATIRRNSAFALGKQAAAIAEGGGGYGGTNAGVMKDSHVAAEMDALNYRYRGVSQAQGLLAQAKSISKQSPLLAGGQLLQGGAQAYSQYQMVKAAST
ncbi:MAG: hypothetical protein V4457_06190 [Pseudomonadota bacterium]